jgi:hypothetical protein
MKSNVPSRVQSGNGELVTTDDIARGVTASTLALLNHAVACRERIERINRLRVKWEERMFGVEILERLDTELLLEFYKAMLEAQKNDLDACGKIQDYMMDAAKLGTLERLWKKIEDVSGSKDRAKVIEGELVETLREVPIDVIKEEIERRAARPGSPVIEVAKEG